MSTKKHGARRGAASVYPCKRNDSRCSTNTTIARQLHERYLRDRQALELEWSSLMGGSPR